MANVLLDSTVLIDYLRGRPGSQERLRHVRDAGDTPYVCAISIEEVSRGLRPHEEDGFIGLTGGLEVAPLGIAEGRLAGFWRRSAAKRGRTLPQADALVAAAAVGVDACVVTGNVKDFTVKGLGVEHWPTGE
jgi:hypothetical protein